jgi:sarcosine oxidase, subunit alpha
VSTKKIDLAIIGAGPAGISAAITAAKYGIPAVILDEQPRPGGRLLCQVHKDPEKPGEWLNGRAIVADLLGQARAAGVEILSRTEVWGIWPSWSVALGGPGRGSVDAFEAKAVLVATGGAENGLPFPGWTRPGVITVGAAQTMMMQSRLLPGQRALVVGTDPLALSVAMEMAEYGVNVVGVVLPPPGPTSGPMANPKDAITNVTRLSRLAPNAALRKLGSLFQQAATLGAHLFPKRGLTVQGVPFMLRRCIIDTTGANGVQSATLANLTPDGELVDGSEREIAVDAVCISGGLHPLAELAEACDCKFAYVEELGGRVPVHRPDMQTTQQGLFVAGSATGIEGAQVAMAQGNMAAIGIARYFGRISEHESASLLEQAAAGVEAARREAILAFNPDVARGRSKEAHLWKEYQAAAAATT